MIAGLLSDRGIVVNRATVSRLRAGSTNGDKIAGRLGMLEVLDKNDASKKDNFYLEIAQLGLRIREDSFRKKGVGFSSKGFIESIAENLKVDLQIIRRHLRAMRVDIVLEETANPNPDLRFSFIKAAELFFDTYRVTKTPPGAIKELDSAWDRRDIGGFYRGYYEILTGAVTQRTWPPYEVEAMEGYYRRRIDSGSTISPFDRLILEDGLKRQPEGALTSRIREDTGIKFDLQVYYAHLNALSAGRS